jgi:hypothetical protein
VILSFSAHGTSSSTALSPRPLLHVTVHLLIDLISVIGLLFYLYAIVRILRTWKQRDVVNKAFWWVALGLIGGAAIGLLFYGLFG